MSCAFCSASRTAVCGDLVELNPPRVLQPERFPQMPRDCLALAVRVGCEVDCVGLARRVLELLDNVAALRDRHVLRLEVLLDLDAELALGQIPHVSHARFDIITRPEEVLQRPRLRGGLNYDQRSRHSKPVLTCRQCVNHHAPVTTPPNGSREGMVVRRVIITHRTRDSQMRFSRFCRIKLHAQRARVHARINAPPEFVFGFLIFGCTTSPGSGALGCPLCLSTIMAGFGAVVNRWWTGKNKMLPTIF